MKIIVSHKEENLNSAPLILKQSYSTSEGREHCFGNKTEPTCPSSKLNSAVCFLLDRLTAPYKVRHNQVPCKNDVKAPLLDSITVDVPRYIPKLHLKKQLCRYTCTASLIYSVGVPVTSKLST